MTVQSRSKSTVKNFLSLNFGMIPSCASFQSQTGWLRNTSGHFRDSNLHHRTTSTSFFSFNSACCTYWVGRFNIIPILQNAWAFFYSFVHFLSISTTWPIAHFWRSYTFFLFSTFRDLARDVAWALSIWSASRPHRVFFSHQSNFEWIEIFSQSGEKSLWVKKETNIGGEAITL